MFVLLGHERINVKLTVDCWITHDALGKYDQGEKSFPCWYCQNSEQV